jgi:hypothetical protein
MDPFGLGDEDAAATEATSAAAKVYGQIFYEDPDNQEVQGPAFFMLDRTAGREEVNDAVLTHAFKHMKVGCSREQAEVLHHPGETPHFTVRKRTGEPRPAALPVVEAEVVLSEEEDDDGFFTGARDEPIDVDIVLPKAVFTMTVATEPSAVSAELREPLGDDDTSTSSDSDWDEDYSLTDQEEVALEAIRDTENHLLAWIRKHAETHEQALKALAKRLVKGTMVLPDNTLYEKDFKSHLHRKLDSIKTARARSLFLRKLVAYLPSSRTARGHTPERKNHYFVLSHSTPQEAVRHMYAKLLN